MPKSRDALFEINLKRAARTISRNGAIRCSILSKFESDPTKSNLTRDQFNLNPMFDILMGE